jgi:DNA-binding CsgD family transcriptional regulator
MGSTETIVKAAARRFGADARPAAIVLTHGHFNHVGALEALAERWRCSVYAHPLELPYITGCASYPPMDPSVGGGAQSLLWDDASFALVKARDADTFLFTRQTSTEFPDWWAAGPSLANARRLTDANPERAQFAWSSGVKLVNYVSDKGDTLQGALYLPANYEPGKQYPLLVTIYERRSQLANVFAQPSATSVPNRTLYTQRGYAVLDPDIVRHLMRRRAEKDPLARLTEREREVLALMAEGRSNTAIGDRLSVTVKTVESHIANIFGKLGLHGQQDDHRRVLAVLAALQAR